MQNQESINISGIVVRTLPNNLADVHRLTASHVKVAVLSTFDIAHSSYQRVCVKNP